MIRMTTMMANDSAKINISVKSGLFLLIMFNMLSQPIVFKPMIIHDIDKAALSLHNGYYVALHV